MADASLSHYHRSFSMSKLGTMFMMVKDPIAHPSCVTSSVEIVTSMSIQRNNVLSRKIK